MGVAEIPKSFIFPFAITQSFFLCIQAFDVLNSNSDLEPKKPLFKVKKPGLNFLLNSNDLHILIVTCLIVGLYGYFVENIFYWVTAGILLSGVLVIKVILLPITKRIIPNYSVRRYVVILLVYTPIICVALGKVNSLLVYQNRKVTYVKPVANSASKEVAIIIDSTKLKLLGFLGDKVIISSLDDKQVYVLNQSAFDVVELERKNKI